MKTVPPTDTDIRYEIETTLIRIGVPSSLIGFRYVVDAITMVVMDRNVINFITNGIYGDIAAKYNTSNKCVERRIRHMIDMAYERANMEKLETYVGYPNARTGKLTNGEFISNFARTVWYKVYGGYDYE